MVRVLEAPACSCMQCVLRMCETHACACSTASARVVVVTLVLVLCFAVAAAAAATQSCITRKGFVYLPSFAHSYSVTNSSEDRRQALAAAEALSWAFNPMTGSLRTFEGWDPPRSTRQMRQLVIMGAQR